MNAKRRIVTPTSLKIILLGFLLFFLTLNLIMHGDFNGNLHARPRDGDCDYYVAMAQNTTALVAHPFGLRILTPLIVKIIKKNSSGLLSWDFTWYMLTFASLFATAIVFWNLLRKVFLLDVCLANLMVICMLGNWIYCFFQFAIPFFPDPLNNLLWMLALYGLYRQRYGLFLITLTVGFLNKEVILFLLPLYPLFVFLDATARGQRLTGVVRALALVAVVGLAYLCFRQNWSYFLHAENYRLFTGWNKSPLETVIYGLSKNKDVLDIFQTFNFLWIPFLLMLWQLYREHGWRDKLFLGAAYIFLPLLVGRIFVTDANRVFVMMLPWVYGLAGLYFQRIRLHENPALLLTIVFIYLALNYGWVQSREWQICFNVVAMLILAVQHNAARQIPIVTQPHR